MIVCQGFEFWLTVTRRNEHIASRLQCLVVQRVKVNDWVMSHSSNDRYSQRGWCSNFLWAYLQHIVHHPALTSCPLSSTQARMYCSAKRQSITNYNYVGLYNWMPTSFEALSIHLFIYNSMTAHTIWKINLQTNIAISQQPTVNGQRN